LLEVIEAVDGPLSSGLPNGASLPDPSREWLQHALDEIALDTRRRLTTITLDRLST
jgi:hypothetical protein